MVVLKSVRCATRYWKQSTLTETYQRQWSAPSGWMEGMLWPASLTVRYAPPYEVSQATLCRAKSCNSRNRGWGEYYFSRGKFLFVRKGGLPTSSFIPTPRCSLLARIRLTACTLGICHPRFLCSGAKQTRNSPANPVFLQHSPAEQ